MSAPLEALLITTARLIQSFGKALELFVREEKKLTSGTRTL